MKRFLVALMLLALPVAAQDTGQHKAANFTYGYDVASATPTYCALVGLNGDPFGAFISGPGTIETSGSSTTVTGVNAADDVFAGVGLGDVIQVRRPDGTVDIRVVVTNADDDTITVETAIDLSAGFTWGYKTLRCGTTADDGWVNVSGYIIAQLSVQYTAGDLDTLDVAMFCREGALGSSSVRVYPGPSSDCGDGTLSGTVCTFATVGQGIAYKIPHNLFTACRVSLAYGSTDGGTREFVTTTISVGR